MYEVIGEFKILIIDMCIWNKKLLDIGFLYLEKSLVFEVYFSICYYYIWFVYFVLD